MTEFVEKIGFIGAGKMGEAIIGALLRSGAANSSQIFIHDIRQDLADALRKNYGITILYNNAEIVQSCDVIFFAVKPQSIDQVLAEIDSANAFRHISRKKLIISILAGIKIKKFEDVIYASLGDNAKDLIAILRVMPNTPIIVGQGMSGLCANRHASKTDIEIVKKLLLTMGKVLECKEKDMDAITAMSGSGPAYCFYLMEAIIEAGVSLGFSHNAATELTVTTLKGALSLFEQQHASPEQLRRNVTSPGGTTEAAIKVLENCGFKNAIINAIQAAARRSKELSDSLF